MSDLGNKDVFAKNLKYYMELHNKNRNDIAKITNVPYSTVSSWCNALYYPRNESFGEINQIKEQIKDKEIQIDNITNAIASGINSPALLEKLQKLEDIKNTLEEQLQFSSNINKTPEINPDMIKYFLKKDTDKLVKNVESKEIIKKWIKKIEVFDDEIIVHFTLDGNSPIRLVAGVRTIIKMRINLKDIQAGT